MFAREHFHGRHHRKTFTGDVCSLHPSVATQEATTQAIAYTYECIRSRKLITPYEAMILAGPVARSKETLFSIARRFAVGDDVDLRDVLCELGHRFNDYA